MILNKRYEFAKLVKEKADLPEIAIKDMSVLIEAFCDTILEQLVLKDLVDLMLDLIIRQRNVSSSQRCLL